MFIFHIQFKVKDSHSRINSTFPRDLKFGWTCVGSLVKRFQKNNKMPTHINKINSVRWEIKENPVLLLLFAFAFDYLFLILAFGIHILSIFVLRNEHVIWCQVHIITNILLFMRQIKQNFSFIDKWIGSKNRTNNKKSFQNTIKKYETSTRQ